MLRILPSIALSCVFLIACDGEPMADAGTDGGPDAGPDDPPAPAPFTELDESARYEVPGLSGHAHVVRTEHDVPHVYASNRLDAMRVTGFVMARDRFFQMDMTRRLSQGRISELLGDAALSTDLQNRQTGATHIAQLYLEGLDDEEAAEIDAFAEGINAFIEAVRDGRAVAPAEYRIGFTLLGARRAVDLMIPWTRADVVATGSTVLYGTSFEGGDVGRARAFENIDRHFLEADGDPFPDRALRMAGLQQDIIDHYAPPNDSSSASGWGLETAGTTSLPIVADRPRHRAIPLQGPPIEQSAIARLDDRLRELRRWYPRDPAEGYGSNSWAVMGSATTDGASLLAGDGHLQLSVPALFWQFGIDTMLMGDSEERTRLMGATIAGLPLMGVGTNGSVAWTQTAYFADVTDWYAERIVLDANGAPMASVFEGRDEPLTRVEEEFVIANVPELGSVGRTETIARWVTFDGRWITQIEGRSVTADEPIGANETRVNFMGDWIVPGDVDGDGIVSGVSFYYGPFDGGTLLRAFRDFSLSDTVEDFRQAMRHFIGYGGSMMASDADGSVLYSAYHAVSCRNHLPRDPGTNVWVEGADPRRLIDGTRFGAWSIPLDDRGRVDEAAATGATSCAVPFDEWPQALNPARQYVHHANNDPGNIATDNDIFDDPFYIGGPWIEGYRAERIEERLQAAITADNADIEEMADIQGDHFSMLGREWAPMLLEAIAAARLASASGSPVEQRLAARWAANEALYTEIEARITAWQDAGFATPSGVVTFYHPNVDAQERTDSIATTIFNHWFPRFIDGVLGDEGIDRNLSPAVTGDTYTMQTIKMLVNGRGPANPLGLGSWSPATEESVFFDDVGTAEIESSEEIALYAIDEAVAFMSGAPSDTPGEGGFGTSDMEQWLWGLRHQVRFESLLGDFLADDPALGVLLDMFSITTERLPLAADLPAGDPRAMLRWFPPPGDQFDVDAANPGLDGTTFSHSSGPVFRLVIALGPDGVRGQNVIPGGQSGDPGTNRFDDQAELWLANETMPLRYLPEEVAEGAVSRERYVPAP
jgi:penicillin amidase